MSVTQELMSYTFTAKYARWIEKEYRRETWKEAIDRVRSMMLDKYSEFNIEEDINWAYDMSHKKRVLGSQRALQFGGKPMMKKHARCFNCVSSYCDRPRFFQEFFWLLLCGCGAGFSVQKHHVAKLPSFYVGVQSNVKTYEIPDTIEGWSDALGVLLTNYFGVQEGMEEFAEYDPDKCGKVEFDYSKIREKGARLSAGTGKAPGPDGLRNSLEKIRELLDRCITDGQTRLRPIDAYDLCMHTSDAVLSGGVRRSATIAIFSPDDLEMARAKTGNWRKENPQRARSNNSAILIRGKTSFEQFNALLEHTKQFGEPGFVWADDEEALFNPCVEIQFWCYDVVDQAKYDAYMEKYKGGGYTGDLGKIGLKSGWQGCNLCTINSGSVKDKEDFLERCKAAAIIGTLQAGFTSFPYLGATSEAIFRREALLGVSMTGTMEKTDIVLDPKIQREGAQVVLDTNERIAKAIGINQAARATCLKPEGTSSCVLGTSSGIHPHHAKRYLRLVQANKDEAPYQFFKMKNPKACEESVWSANKTDDVIYFPIEVPNGAKTKNQMAAVDLLKLVKSTQQNWVEAGTRESLCTQPWLRHNVSNTITVQPDEWGDVSKFIYGNREYFCGISLLPQSGDKDYKQAPFTAVYTSKEIVREYGDAAIWTSGLIEDALKVFDEDLWAACDFILNDQWKDAFDGDAETVEEFHKIAELAAKRLNFMRNAKKYAKKYFGDDTKKLTYCLKDVYNWKRYCDLKESFQKVDYLLMIETEDNTAPEEAIACAGGACIV